LFGSLLKTIKPKVEEEGMKLRSSARLQRMEERAMNPLRSLSGSLQAKAMATSNINKDAVGNSNIIEKNGGTKVKKKDLKIKIPNTNKSLENQMNVRRFAL
jgi:hypothetical protein